MNIKKLVKLISFVDAHDIPVVLNLCKKYYPRLRTYVAKHLGVQTFHYRTSATGVTVTYLKGDQKVSMYKSYQEWAQELFGIGRATAKPTEGKKAEPKPMEAAQKVAEHVATAPENTSTPENPESVNQG